jgi:hypothetical protein
MKRKNGAAAALGRIGGKNRASVLTAEERRAIARQGGLAKAANRANGTAAALVPETELAESPISTSKLFRDGVDQRNHERNLRRQERRLKKGTPDAAL